MKRIVLTIAFLAVSLSIQAQILGRLPEPVFNSIGQNSVSNMEGTGDTLWIGPLLQRNIGNSADWLLPQGIDSITAGRGRVFSIHLETDTVFAGLGFNESTEDGSVQVGMGFYLSTDAGLNWDFIPIPLEAQNDTVFQYGANRIEKLPVVVPQQSPPFETAFRGQALFSAPDSVLMLCC